MVEGTDEGNQRTGAKRDVAQGECNDDEERNEDEKSVLEGTMTQAPAGNSM